MKKIKNVAEMKPLVYRNWLYDDKIKKDKPIEYYCNHRTIDGTNDSIISDNGGGYKCSICNRHINLLEVKMFDKTDEELVKVCSTRRKDFIDTIKLFGVNLTPEEVKRLVEIEAADSADNDLELVHIFNNCKGPTIEWEGQHSLNEEDKNSHEISIILALDTISDAKNFVENIKYNVSCLQLRLDAVSNIIQHQNHTICTSIIVHIPLDTLHVQIDCDMARKGRTYLTISSYIDDETYRAISKADPFEDGFYTMLYAEAPNKYGRSETVFLANVRGVGIDNVDITSIWADNRDR